MPKLTDCVANALRVVFDPKETGVEAVSSTRLKGYYTGAIRQPDGTWKRVRGEYDWSTR